MLLGVNLDPKFSTTSGSGPAESGTPRSDKG